MELGSYEFDGKKVAIGTAASLIGGLALGWAWYGIARSSSGCGSIGVSPDSYCSVYNFFDDTMCPAGYTTFYETCKYGFQQGSSALFEAVKGVVSYSSDGWPQLQNEYVFNASCHEDIPPYNATQYRYCGPIHVTTCVNAAWEGFVSILAVPCQQASKHTGLVTGAVTGTLAGAVGMGITLFKAVSKRRVVAAASSGEYDEAYKTLRA